jgi:hypothetical protein
MNAQKDKSQTKVSFWLTNYRLKLLRSLANEKHLTLSEILRIGSSAVFMLLKNRTPEEAVKLIRDVVAMEKHHQAEIDKAVAKKLKEAGME